MSTRTLRAGAAGAVLLAVFAAGAAPAGAVTGAKFKSAQLKLELQLADRSARLVNLQKDVTNAGTSLSTVHINLLSARLGTEQTSINGLITKVPGDTTWAELNSDNRAMLADNRVYAVMTPQVFETIWGDVVLTNATSLNLEKSTLQGEVTSLLGDPGYNNALNHLNNFVRKVSNVTTDIPNVEARELAQSPTGYPGNTHVFVNSNEAIRDANIALADADYDASVIALATGGYTGP